MGVFDRLWNLGRGRIRTLRPSRDEGLSEAELLAELGTTPAKPEAPQRAAPEDAQVEAEPETAPPEPERDADGSIKKTL